jgi:hypothetical protein
MVLLVSDRKCVWVSLVINHVKEVSTVKASHKFTGNFEPKVVRSIF